jgi:hypothetical protein
MISVRTEHLQIAAQEVEIGAHRSPTLEGRRLRAAAE